MAENENLSQEDLDNIDDNDLNEDDPPKDDPPKDDPPKDDPPKDDPKDDDDPKHFSSKFKDEKTRKLAERYNTEEDLATALLKGKQKLSERSQGPLPKDADEVEIAAFRKAFNVPETAEEYKFPEIPDEANTEENQENRKEWQELFHKHHAPKELVDAILQKYGEDAVNIVDNDTVLNEKFATESDAELRKDWGDQYDTNKSFANHAAKEMFGDTLDDVQHIKMENGRPILDHPAFIGALSKIGREMGEGAIGDTITETEKESLEEKANSYRSKAKEAQLKGLTNEANKWSAKELETLERIDKSEKAAQK